MREPVTLDRLRQEPALAATLAPEDRLRLLADAGAVLEVLRAALVTPPTSRENGHHEPDHKDRLLSAEQVALALALDVESVVRRRFPFRVKVGKYVRFSEAGFNEYLRGLEGARR